MSGTKEQKIATTGVSGSNNQVKGDVVTICKQIIYQTTTNDQRLINKAKAPDLKLPVQTALKSKPAESMKNPVESFSCIGEASSIRESEHNAAEALMKQLKKELNITFSIVKNKPMKSQLKEICDKFRWECNPEYELVLKSGQSHAPKFISKVTISGNFHKV